MNKNNQEIIFVDEALANQIMAKFMETQGRRFWDGSDTNEGYWECQSCGGEYPVLYTESLDAQSKVWTKLGVVPKFELGLNGKYKCSLVGDDGIPRGNAEGNSLRESGGISTALLIRLNSILKK